jgi:hypothetical protein
MTSLSSGGSAGSSRQQPVHDERLVEYEFSDEGKTILRQSLTGCMTPQEIEATVNKRQLLPRSFPRSLSQAARDQLEQVLAELKQDTELAVQRHG